MVDSSDVALESTSGGSSAGRGLGNKSEKTVPPWTKPPEMRRTQRVDVRLNQAEYEAICVAAEAGQKEPSKWLREVGLAVAAGTGDDVSATPVDGPRPQSSGASVAVQQQMLEVGKARAVLAAIGNNVNQIAKGVNAGQPLEATQAAAMYRFIRTHVNTLDAEVRRLRAVSER